MKPEFLPGDIVAVYSSISPKFNTNRTLVLKVALFGPGEVEYSNGEFNKKWGFWYRLSNIPHEDDWAMESSLRLPPTSSFKSIMEELNDRNRNPQRVDGVLRRYVL